ncbi:MAG: hypothetical protein ACE147_11215 [Candidatus Methylomirabilales bacterium]
MLAALILAVPHLAHAVEFASCTDVRAYFAAPLPRDPYAREQDLENAMDLLRQHSGPGVIGCEDWVVERAYFELATARHELSRTFAADPPALRYRAGEAAKAYADYLDWFLSLSEARRNRLIAFLTKTQEAPAEAIRAERRRWMRSRPGNVLMGMGAAFVDARAQDELLLKYGEYFREGVEIYSNQVAREWRKWLRALPDFKAARSDAQVRALIAEDAEVRSQWEVFGEFLAAFVQANPSVKREWDAIARRIEQWLAE